MNKIITISDEKITDRIYYIRDKKVMLYNDLAELYDVDNKQLKRQVRRNIERFPEDFMFELTAEEYDSLRCQIGALKIKRGEHTKYLPFAFTEQVEKIINQVDKMFRRNNISVENNPQPKTSSVGTK